MSVQATLQWGLGESYVDFCCPALHLELFGYSGIFSVHIAPLQEIPWSPRAILSACKPRARPHLTYTNVRKKPSPVCYREVKVLSYVCWNQFSTFAPIFWPPSLPLPRPPSSVYFSCTPPTSPPEHGKPGLARPCKIQANRPLKFLEKFDVLAPSALLTCAPSAHQCLTYVLFIIL